jgi:hypothetical protein
MRDEVERSSQTLPAPWGRHAKGWTLPQGGSRIHVTRRALDPSSTRNGLAAWMLWLNLDDYLKRIRSNHHFVSVC